MNTKARSIAVLFISCVLLLSAPFNGPVYGTSVQEQVIHSYNLFRESILTADYTKYAAIVLPPVRTTPEAQEGWLKSRDRYLKEYPDLQESPPRHFWSEGNKANFVVRAWNEDKNYIVLHHIRFTLVEGQWKIHRVPRGVTFPIGKSTEENEKKIEEYINTNEEFKLTRTARRPVLINVSRDSGQLTLPFFDYMAVITDWSKENPKLITIGRQAVAQVRFYLREDDDGYYIRAGDMILNTGDAEVSYAFYVTVFDKDNRIIGAAQSHSYSSAIKAKSNTSMNCNIQGPYEELVKAVSYQMVLYEYQWKTIEYQDMR